MRTPSLIDTPIDIETMLILPRHPWPKLIMPGTVPKQSSSAVKAQCSRARAVRHGARGFKDFGPVQSLDMSASCERNSCLKQRVATEPHALNAVNDGAWLWQALKMQEYTLLCMTCCLLFSFHVSLQLQRRHGSAGEHFPVSTRSTSWLCIGPSLQAAMQGPNSGLLVRNLALATTASKSCDFICILTLRLHVGPI